MDKTSTTEFDIENEEILIEYDIQEKEEEITNRKSNPILSNYELSNLLAERTKQIEELGKSTLSMEEIKEKNLIFSHKIAEEEFKQGKLPPFKIKRYLPDGRYELWDIKEMKFFPDF